MKIKLNLLHQEEKLFYGLIEVIFQTTAITFIILLAIEYLLPGFVTNWFNPIWLLITAIISGIITTINS